MSSYKLSIQFHADGAITTLDKKYNVVNEIKFQSLEHLRSCSAYCGNFIPQYDKEDARLFATWEDTCCHKDGTLNKVGRRYERKCDDALGLEEFSNLDSHVRDFLTETYGYFENYSFSSSEEEINSSEDESEEDSEFEESDVDEESDHERKKRKLMTSFQNVVNTANNLLAEWKQIEETNEEEASSEEE